MSNFVDGSLYLGWDAKRGKPQGPDEAALSVSTLKLYKEDPMKFFLRKVLKIQEPQTVALAFGTAGHDGLDAFLRVGEGDRRKASISAFKATLADKFSEVAEPSLRYNENDPTNPRDKVDVPVTLGELEAFGEALLLEVFDMYERGGYDVMEVVSAPTDRTELTLGKVARDRGMPTHEVKLWNRKGGKWRKEVVPCGLVAGVPFHGYIDQVAEWTDGSPLIVDHKFVSSIISYYPQWNGERRMYTPSYDPADDLQLDIYAYCTDITRAGFQFITKLPQYVPETGILHPNWVDVNQWHGLGRIGTQLPLATGHLGDNADLHYAFVWRPAPEDHVSRPNAYTRMQIMARTTRAVREVAQQMTESILLYMDGVAPEIAFPAGDPEEISRKACPFCFFKAEGHCPTPRDGKGADEAYQQVRIEREKLCLQNKEIQERRRLWSALRS